MPLPSLSSLPSKGWWSRRSRNTKRRLVFYGALLFIIIATVAFMTSMPGQSFRGAQPALDAREAALDSRLRELVETLATEIGERNIPDHAPALADAARFIETTLKASALEPRSLAADVGKQHCENIDAEIRGVQGDIVLVGAHYDSALGTRGADDNASGSAAVLALAERYAKRYPKDARDKPRRTLRFALFVNEEPPYFWNANMGSLVYAKAARAKNEPIAAMLSLETMGYFTDAPGSQKYPVPVGFIYPSAGDFIGFVGNVASRSLTRRAVRTFRARAHVPSEGVAFPGFIPGVGWSDHWSFWQAGYEAVMVTDTAPFRNPHYHKSTDTPETLDYARFARVVAGLEDVIDDLLARD